jgi:hypothetical protein
VAARGGSAELPHPSADALVAIAGPVVVVERRPLLIIGAWRGGRATGLARSVGGTEHALDHVA